ncbi:hypothetical protein EDD35_6658 [Amycolatopsis thermoflava]|uniref:Uncharacterized protein n=1 Tax=Amycolatopsis thermoflava TaxID=84480 RepID=A0A3N2H5N4_9PSEU|nr:hypothetical protein EDD35_6658 [Amycolatopsis thermoflava]
MAEFFATVLAKIGANLIESLILRLTQSLFARAYAPAV